jgi:hypothetical protein
VAAVTNGEAFGTLYRAQEEGEVVLREKEAVAGAGQP